MFRTDGQMMDKLHSSCCNTESTKFNETLKEGGFGCGSLTSILVRDKNAWDSGGGEPCLPPPQSLACKLKKNKKNVALVLAVVYYCDTASPPKTTLQLRSIHCPLITQYFKKKIFIINVNNT